MDETKQATQAMQLICTSCFIRPAPASAECRPDPTMVCPEGDAVPGRPSADALHCDRCGGPVHFDGLTRAWYAH